MGDEKDESMREEVDRGRWVRVERRVRREAAIRDF
jgi:hypothetical protein